VCRVHNRGALGAGSAAGPSRRDDFSLAIELVSTAS
jgi:hypothetical protein